MKPIIQIQSIKQYTPFLLFLCATFLVSCGDSEKEISLEMETSSNKIEVNNTQFTTAKMEIGTFTKQPFNQVIKVNGMMDVPPENKSTVSAYFGGYIKDIKLIEGQMVQKGQSLFILENPEYIQIQQDYLEAKSMINYLKADFDRQNDLAKDNVSSQKTFLKAESDYKVTLARLESLKKKLRLMNIDPTSVSADNLVSTIPVYAPISGYITSIHGSKGMFLNPSDVALTILNTDHMHIELQVFEQDLSKLSVKQEVKFRVQNNSKTYDAEIYLINKAINLEKRTINVHCHFKNEKQSKLFTPGMYVEAEIISATDSLLALPKAAILNVEDKTCILIQQSKTNNGYTFYQKEVITGKANGKFIEIKNSSDFNPNDNVLTNGAFNLIP